MYACLAQIRLAPDSAKRVPRMRAFFTVRPGRVSSKRLPRKHFYFKIANSNHIGILDILVTETTLVITDTPGPLPLRSQIRQILAKSGPGRIWDDDAGVTYGVTTFPLSSHDNV